MRQLGDVFYLLRKMCFFASSHCDNAAKKQLSSQKAVSVTEERLFARWDDKHTIKWRLFESLGQMREKRHALTLTQQ